MMTAGMMPAAPLVGAVSHDWSSHQNPTSTRSATTRASSRAGFAPELMTYCTSGWIVSQGAMAVRQVSSMLVSCALVCAARRDARRHGDRQGHGGGFPVGACLATERAAAGMVVGTHGSTYGGNPLAMAACEAVLEIVATPEFLAHVRAMGAQLRGALEQMIPNHDWLFDHVRGMGLMLGIKLKSDSRAFVNHARSFGILTVAAGDNVVRILPPLNIEEEHIRECVEKLSAAAAAYKPAQAA